MLLRETNRSHVFYYADRAGLLKEGQEITLDENGLSYFGRFYWPIFHTKLSEEMNSALAVMVFI